MLNIAHKEVYGLLKNGFTSSADMKELYAKVFTNLGITITPKATMIADNPYVVADSTRKGVNSITVRGYGISKNRIKK